MALLQELKLGYYHIAIYPGFAELNGILSLTIGHAAWAW